MKCRIYDNHGMDLEELDEQIEMLLRSRRNLEVEGYQLSDGFCIQAEDTENKDSVLVIFLTKVKSAISVMIGYMTPSQQGMRFPFFEAGKDDSLITSILSFTDAYHKQMSFE